MSRFQFVADHRDAFEVKRLCEILEVARSSFYAWCAAAEGRDARAAADAELAERIRVVHDADSTQGAPRITAELNDGVPDAGAGQPQAGRPGDARTPGSPATGGGAGSGPPCPSRPTRRCPTCSSRDFTAERSTPRYVGDITYLPLADGANLYLATVIDCFSRRVAGWAIAEHMRTELVADALNAAAALRGSLAGAVFHSDHGSQYTSKDFAQLCSELGVTQSMGAVGTSADNALAESFNATLKREVLQDRSCWPDAATCRRIARRRGQPSVRRG